MANKGLDACDGSNLQLVWILYWLASLFNWSWSDQITYQRMYIIKSTAINLDHRCWQSVWRVRFDGQFDVRFNGWFDIQFDGWFDGQFNVQFDGRFDGRFDGWFGGWFNLAVLGYQPQQSIWQLRQDAKWPRCFTGLFYRLIVLRALNGYQLRGR